MKLVILTNNNSYYGKMMIQQLEAANISLEKVIVIKQTLKYYAKLFNYVNKRVGFAEATLFSFRLLFCKIFNNKNTIKYKDFKSNIIFTKGTNSIKTETILKKLKPDIIVLAQTGIINNNIISIPRIGVLNSHPAILPYYRGIDCYKWAILYNELSKIGSSVHWVNKGVDTGNIIKIKHFDIRGIKNTQEIEENIDLLCVENMKEVLITLIKGNLSNGIIQNIEDGRQYYKMPLKLEKKVKNLIKKNQ